MVTKFTCGVVTSQRSANQPVPRESQVVWFEAASAVDDRSVQFMHNDWLNAHWQKQMATKLTNKQQVIAIMRRTWIPSLRFININKYLSRFFAMTFRAQLLSCRLIECLISLLLRITELTPGTLAGLAMAYPLTQVLSKWLHWLYYYIMPAYSAAAAESEREYSVFINK